jgi:hypothetical protein
MFTSTQTHESNRRRIVQGMTLAAAGTLLSGCLLDSPYWNQVFSDHTAAIPIQTFTNVNSSAVKIECAQAYHAGLHPSQSSATWRFVDNLTVQSQGLLDPLGGKVYGAGKMKVLPSNCWRFDPANSKWYTALRASQETSIGTSTFVTFTKSGLECLGRTIGQGANWFANWGPCTKKYSGTQTAVKYVIFHATA